MNQDQTFDITVEQLDSEDIEINNRVFQNETEELIHDILDESVPKQFFKDYRLWQINSTIRDIQFKRLVLDLKEDFQDIPYDQFEEYALACIQFLHDYRAINDEWIKLKKAQRIHKEVSSLINTKKPSKN